MSYYLGIDGGGTATKCLVTDKNGSIVARGESGPSNYLVVGRDEAARSIRSAVNKALSAGGLAIADIRSASLGMAGGDRPKDRAVLESIWRDLGFQSLLALDHDGMIALQAGTDGKPGVVVIAGTGAIGFGVNDEGARYRVDGWGPIVGDFGSGYAIGRDAIIASLRDYDGRGPSTGLTETLLRQLGLNNMSEIIGEVYGGGLDRAHIAGLARLVFQVAEDGDRVAVDIIQQAGRELGLTAATVVNKLALEKAQVVCSGGVFKAGDVIVTPFKNSLHKLASTAVVTFIDTEPAVGAVYMAFKNDGAFSSDVVTLVKNSYRSFASE